MSSQPTSLASDIIRYVRGRCRLGSNPPNAAFQTTQMLLALNDINEWFWYWPLDNGSMAPWKISRRRKAYTTIANTTLNGAVLANATSLILTSGTNFDSPEGVDVGAVYVKIKQNGVYLIVPYETKTSNTLSVCSGIDVALATGLSVYKLYATPSDYGRPIQMKVDGRPYDFCDNEFDDLPPQFNFMTHYLKSTNGFDKFFLALPDNMQSGRIVLLNYVKKPTKIDEDTDKVDAPDGVARWALLKKFESFVWTHRGEDRLALDANVEAERFIKQFAATQSGEDAGSNQDPTFDLD